MTNGASISRLVVRQSDSLIANRYTIHTADAEGQPLELLAVAQQKVMAMKKQVTFYADTEHADPVFGFKGRESIETYTVYDVTDADGNQIAWFNKQFRASITRSTWELTLPRIGLEAVGTERSRSVALARRGWNLVLGEYMRAPLLFHFDFRTAEGIVVMTCNRRRRRLRDVYDVALPVFADDIRLDWRVGAALGVAMDTLEHR